MKKQTALMNHWQLCQYLRKLHLPQVVPPPDLATLKLLQDAHLKYVPYENLDILSGRLTSLEHDDMFAKTEEYIDNFATPYQAAMRGMVDLVIEPQNTRPTVINALQMLQSKRETRPAKRHGNIPL